MEYDLVICGGTFDRLHVGHKAFLTYAFSQGKHVIIGLTSDRYVEEYKKDKTVTPFLKRKQELQDFLMDEGFKDRAMVVAIDSRFDQTQIPDEKGKKVALLVSSETENTGIEINEERKRNGLVPLNLIVFPLIKNDEEEIISSSKVREGIMDRTGVMLPKGDFLSKTLFLPDSLREILHRPFGILFTGEIPKQFLRYPDRIVTIGDITTKRIHDLGIQQKLAIIDFFVERKKTYETLNQLGFTGSEKIIHVTNPAGQLSSKIWNKLLNSTKNIISAKQTIIIVEGEEDLFVIPLILMLPLSFFIMYGQPTLSKTQKEGVVILEITEELKHQTFQILRQFVRK